MKVSPYLSFNGNCAEALAFYETALGAKVEGAMTWGESPMAGQCPPGDENKIMHAAVQVGESLVMCSDAPPTMYSQPQGITVSLHVDDTGEAERVFGALSDGGTVRFALAETFWAKKFGMVVDRFGIPWMVNCSKPM